MSLIGRQPISDKDYTILGYDILFREEGIQTDCSDISISASVLEKVLNVFGLENVLGGYLGFLKIDIEFLKSDIIYTIPQENFILMILESSLDDPTLEEVLKGLIEKGYRFGINSCVLDERTIGRIESLHPYLEYVRIDALRNSTQKGVEAKKRLKALNLKLIAFKIETREAFEQYKEYGVDYFQGYYIKRPYTIENEELSLSQGEVFRIWDLVQQDAGIEKIVKALEESHALLLKLMQFINSSYFSFSCTITSVRQVITLVGRKALGNWLLLMLMTHKSDQPTNHPLLLMVINRTEIVTGLLKLSEPLCTREELDTAYLVGMLSLIHLLLNMDHREFLHKLHVSEEIEEAMFEAQGKWGQLLTVARYIENMDSESIKPFIERYHINLDDMDKLISQAMEKVNAFDAMLQHQFI